MRPHTSRCRPAAAGWTTSSTCSCQANSRGNDAAAARIACASCVGGLWPVPWYGCAGCSAIEDACTALHHGCQDCVDAAGACMLCCLCTAQGGFELCQALGILLSMVTAQVVGRVCVSLVNSAIVIAWQYNFVLQTWCATDLGL